MFKHIIALALALTFGLASTFAAPAGTSARVTSAEDNTIQLVIDGEMASWLKKGTVVRVTNQEGKIVEKAAKVTAVSEKTVTLSTKEEAKVKSGEAVSLQKGRVMSGC